MSYSWNFDYPQIARDSGFKLKQFQDGSINWRAIGSVEIARLVSDQDFEQIDCLLSYLSEAPLVPVLQSNVLESGLCKFFGLAQLGIQYLLFCKKFLDKTVAGLREALRENQAENYKLRSQNDEINKEFLRLHQKLERLEEINKVLYPCPTCPKNFVSSEMLKTHIARKHSHDQTKSAEVSDRTLINTIKLELEIKQLKERLNAAEKQIKESSLPQKQERTTSPAPKIISDDIKELKTSSVQTEVVVTNIGIQTNLSDDKDFDEVVDNEYKINQELLQEIREKISDIEKSKTQDSKFSQKFMEAVMEKLQTLKSTKDSISVEKDIQPAIVKAIRNHDDVYMDRLNGIAEKIEGSLRITFSDLQDELKQLCKTQETVQTTVGNLLKERSSQDPGNCAKEIKEVKRCLEIGNSATQTEEVEKKEDESMMHPGTSGTKKENSVEKKSFVDYFNAEVHGTPSPILKNARKASEQRTVHRKKKQSKGSSVEHKAVDINAELRARLADLGISSKAESLPEKVSCRAMELIAKRHKSQKVLKFLRIRNQIKKVVEKLSTKRLSREMDHTSLGSGSSETSLDERVDQKDSPKKLDDFKLRLEKILSTPIEKAKKSPYSTPILVRSLPPQGNSALKKPVPVPRKKVVFNLEEMKSPSSDG